MEAERISIDELREKLERGERLQILDVRNRIDYMRSHSAIPGSVRVPADKIGGRMGELDPAVETVAYCT